MKMIFLICKSSLLTPKFDFDRVRLYSAPILSNSHTCSDEGFIEPPSKKAKTSSSKPAMAASEALAPATAPAAQVSTASSLSKGKEIPSTAAVTVSPPEKPVSLSYFDNIFDSSSPRVGLHWIINFSKRISLPLLISLGFSSGHFFPGGLRFSIFFS
jgi:hypothetical protein